MSRLEKISQRVRGGGGRGGRKNQRWMWMDVWYCFIPPDSQWWCVSPGQHLMLSSCTKVDVLRSFCNTLIRIELIHQSFPLSIFPVHMSDYTTELSAQNPVNTVQGSAARSQSPVCSPKIFFGQQEIGSHCCFYQLLLRTPQRAIWWFHPQAQLLV